MNSSSRIILTTRPLEKFYPVNAPEGFSIVNIPLTEIRELPVDWDHIWASAPQVLVFTSTVGARIFLDHEGGNSLKDPEVIAIGNATAQELSRRFHGIAVPSRQSSDGIVELLRTEKYSGKTVALFSSAKSNRIIQNYLSANGFQYIQCDLYDAVPVRKNELNDYLSRNDVVCVIITSSHEARLFREIAGSRATLKPLFAIGETTARTMRDLGISPSEPVGNSDLSSLVQEVCRKFLS